MPSRLELQTLLETLLGSRNVYYQPPMPVKMGYPAIVYKLDNIESTYADDGVYSLKKRYSVTTIDSNPDSSVVDKVASLPTCRFDRQFSSDNLYHTVFRLRY